MRGDQVNTACLTLRYETDCCVTVTKKTEFTDFTWQPAHQGTQLSSIERLRVVRLERIVQNPACWFSTRLHVILPLAAKYSYPDCKKVLHDASAEHTLEGGQSVCTNTHTTSFYRPANVINCKSVALVFPAWVIIRNQAGTRGPKLEMTSSIQTLQCPVADVSWNWVTPAPTPSPPLSSSTCLYTGA